VPVAIQTRAPIEVPRFLEADAHISKIGRFPDLKAEIRSIGLDLALQTVPFTIYDLGPEMQESFNFEILQSLEPLLTRIAETNSNRLERLEN
jgi:hypothetical protein